jgi:ankyrin repeat protein
MEKKGLNFLLKVLRPVSHLLVVVVVAITYTIYNDLYLLNSLVLFLIVVGACTEIFFQIRNNYIGLEKVINFTDFKKFCWVQKRIIPYSRSFTEELAGENLVTFFVKKNSKEAMTYLQKKEGFMLIEENKFRQTPIQIAILLRDKGMVNKLLSLGVAIENAGSIVSEIIKEGDCDYLEYLIHLGVPLDEMDDKGNYPVHYAISSGCMCCINKLKEAGLFFGIKNAEGDPPIINAIKNGAFVGVDYVDLKIILKSLDLLTLNELDLHGKSALMYSISLSQYMVADILIDIGVYLEDVGFAGENLLDICLETRDSKLINRVIKAAPYLVTGNNNVVTNIIKYSDEKALIQVLDFGIEIGYRDGEGKTFLDHAIEAGNIRVIDLLISNGIDINRVDKSGRSSVFKLVIGNEDRYYLLEHLVNNENLNIHLQDNGHKNILSYSILNGLYKESDLLISLGAESQLNEGELLRTVNESVNEDLLELLIKNNIFPSKFAVIELMKGRENKLLSTIIELEDFSDMDLKDLLIYAVYGGNIEATKILYKLVNIDHTHAILHASLGGHNEILEILLSSSDNPLFVKTMDRIIITPFTADDSEKIAILKEYKNNEYGARLDYIYVEDALDKQDKQDFVEFSINEGLLSGNYSIEPSEEHHYSIFFQYKDNKYEPEYLVK